MNFSILIKIKMKTLKTFLMALVAIAFCAELNAQTIWTEDFDGSNTTNAPTLTGECTDETGDYFGIVGSADINITYGGAIGNFLSAQDTDDIVADAVSGCMAGSVAVSADFTDIDVSSCGAELYLCFDIADAPASDGANDWDASSSIVVSVDGASVANFASTETNSVGVANGDATSTCTVGGTFTTYCSMVTIPADGTADINIAINGMDAADEDVAVDNITFICGVANLPAANTDFADCEPSVCDLMLVEGTATCDANTTGTDTYTAIFTFTDTDGLGTYTVTASNGTPDMATVVDMASGTITVTGATEGIDVVLTITDGTDCNLMVTVMTPTCTAACPDITDSTLSATVGGMAATDICSGDAVTVCIDVDLTNDPTAIVEFSNDGGATWVDGTPDMLVPPVTTHTVTVNNSSTPYNISPGPYYIGDMVSYEGNNVHPITITAPSGGALVSGATSNGTFTAAAGTYNFQCDVHTPMSGSITFVERPQATEFCVDFTETNTACNPAIVSYQAQFNAATLADVTCSLDNQTMGAGGAAVSVNVYPIPTAPMITVDDAVCNYSIMPACPNDVLTPDTFGPAAPGDDPAAFDVMVSNAGGCMATFSVDPPVCPMDMDMACAITDLVVTPTACNPDDNTYSLDISFTVTNPGASDMFNVDVCGTAFGPFAYSALPLNIPGLTADGTVGCTVTVTDADNVGGGTGGTIVPTTADDVFVSFVPDGLGSGGGVDECDSESVTIHNFATDASGTCVTIDISDFTLTDNVGVFYTFPAGTTIPPGGSLTLTSTQMVGPCTGTAGMGDGGGSQFSNSGDNALLSDASGAAIDDTGTVDGDPGVEYESPALTAAGGAGSAVCGGAACTAMLPYDAPASCMVMCPMDIEGTLGADMVVCSDDPAVDLMVVITGSGTGPYTVTYNDGTMDIIITGYNNGDVITVSPTTTTTYTLVNIIDTNDCAGTASGTALITVNDPPNAGMAGTAMACSNAADGVTIVDLDGALTGMPDAAGVWTETTASGVSLANTMMVDFDGVAPGMYTFTYTVSGDAPCADATADVVVTVSDCSVPCPTIDASIAADATVCADNTASTLTVTITGGTGPYTIMYSDGTTQTVTNYNSGDPIAVSPTATTTYMLTGVMDANMCPATLGTTDVTITVVDLPVAGTTTPATACNDSAEGISVVDLNSTLTDADAGGVWSEMTTSGADITDPNMVDFNGIAPGVYTFVYTVAATAPCVGDATVSVDITVTDCAVPGCTLVLSPETVTCDAETAGTDTYTVSIPFDNGTEGFPGGMNYTITTSGTLGGDNPMVVQSGTITIIFNEGSPYDYSIQGTMGNPNELCDFMISDASPTCEPIVCEDEIAGIVIADASCDLTGITVTITDDMGTLITTLTTDAAGVYDSTPAVFPCGNYFAELTAGVPVCYGDAVTGPLAFTIDGDTDMMDTDGITFGNIMAIPTVGEWGLIILLLLMSIVAVVGIRERKASEVNA